MPPARGDDEEEEEMPMGMTSQKRKPGKEGER